MPDVPSSPGPEMSPSSPPPASGTAAAPGATPDRAPQPGVAARCFDLLAGVAPLFLLVLWFMRALPGMLGRHARGVHGAVSDLGDALAFLPPGPAAGDAAFAAVQPVYPLFLKALAGFDTAAAAVIPGLARIPAAERLAGAGAGLACLLFLLLTWGLALAAGYGKRAALAAGCALFIMLSLAGLPPAAGASLLSGAILAAGLLCLGSGWARPFAPLRLCAGFALAALATLSAGLPSLALPLLASLFFLLWRGTVRRAGALDGALGFGLMLVILLGRAAWLFLWAGPEGKEELRLFIDSGFLAPLTLARATWTGDWWIVFPLLLVLWLPFPLLLPFLHWERIGALPGAFLKNRAACPGHGWIWACLLSGLLVFCLLGVHSLLPLLLLLPPLAVLTGQGLMELASGRSRAFFLVMSLVLLALALLLAFGGLYPLFTGVAHPALALLYAVPAPAPAALYEMLARAGVCLLFALLLLKATDRSFPGGSLLVLTLFAACLALPLLWHAPALSNEPAGGEAPVPETAAHPGPPVSQGLDGAEEPRAAQPDQTDKGDQGHEGEGTAPIVPPAPPASAVPPDAGPTMPAPTALHPATPATGEPAAEPAPRPLPEPAREALPEQTAEPALPATGQMPAAPAGTAR